MYSLTLEGGQGQRYKGTLKDPIREGVNKTILAGMSAKLRPLGAPGYQKQFSAKPKTETENRNRKPCVCMIICMTYD